MLRTVARLESVLREQRGFLFPWCPVFLGLGIGIYYLLRFEPDRALVGGILALSLPLLVWARRDRTGFAAIPTALLCVILGFHLAVWRAHEVAAPRLDLRYNGSVEGRVIKVDRSSSDALRLTLDQVSMWDLGQRPAPDRVRISLHGKAAEFRPGPLQRINVKARMAPPAGPVEPGGFDFQRHAWFLRLGALGYTRNPPEVVSEARAKWSIAGARHALSKGIRVHLAGDIGAFAAAITTGDRSHLKQATTETLRTTNLAHLLAISGLHMGLLVGVVFSGLRLLMSLWPSFALRIHVKKWAAGGALCAAAGYLLLSGASIATERAFVMAAVALVAVMLDRRAISMRSVAIAALIVLALRPESLLSPGFHMSFAATTALVWVFSVLRDQSDWPGPRWLKPIIAVALTSFVAGAATAPFAAAHFNGYAAYGLPANLLAVPVMGIIVMPAAVVSLCLAPFGLEGVSLTVMGWGLNWILWVAEGFASIKGARVPVVAPPEWALVCISLGGIFVMLWQGWGRVLGLVPMVIGAALWMNASRPDVLIIENLKLIGVRTEDGRGVSRAKGQGFAARTWLENDGDDADQPLAFARFERAMDYTGGFEIDGWTVRVLRGKSLSEQSVECGPKDILIAFDPITLSGPCIVFDPRKMAKTGALAIHISEQDARVISVHQTRGHRLWSPSAEHQ